MPTISADEHGEQAEVRLAAVREERAVEDDLRQQRVDDPEARADEDHARRRARPCGGRGGNSRATRSTVPRVGAASGSVVATWLKRAMVARATRVAAAGYVRPPNTATRRKR